MALTAPAYGGNVVPFPAPAPPQEDPRLEAVKWSLATLVRAVDDYYSRSIEARELAETCREFFDGDQLSPADKAERERRKQMPLSLNLVRQKIETLVGLEIQLRTDPRAYARDPSQEPGAEFATNVLRFLDEVTDFDEARTIACEQLLVEGTAALLGEVDRTKPPGREAEVAAIDHLDLVYDYDAKALDFADARFLGFNRWYIDTDAEDLFGGGTEEGRERVREAVRMTIDAMDGREEPTNTWAKPSANLVRIATLYYRTRLGWMCATFTRGGVLHHAPSAYYDAQGRACCPIKARSLFRKPKSGVRYGYVADLLWPQREINERRSMLLHRARSRQTWSTIGAVSDVNVAKRELAKPDGHVELQVGQFGESFGVLPTGDQSALEGTLLQQVTAVFDGLGPGVALGEPARSASGRAQEITQVVAGRQVGRFTDAIRRLSLEMYRHLWCIAQDHMDRPFVVRIGDGSGGARYAPVNDPMGRGPQLAQLDVDIVLDAEPETVTLKGEQWAKLAELAATKAVPIPPEVIIEASSLPNKRRLLDALERARQQQGPPPQVQMQMRMQAEKVGAEVEQARATAEHRRAQAEALRAANPIGTMPAEGTVSLPPPGMTGDTGPPPFPGA